jgi:putative acetyltransferase
MHMGDSAVTDFSSSYRIRDAVPTDAAKILDVHRQSILSLGLSGYSENETESWAAGLVPEGYGIDTLASGHVMEVAQFTNGEIVAFCHSTPFEIRALFVLPDHSRRGLASKLLQNAEFRSRRAGSQKIEIDAALSGQYFWKHHGFVVDREID